jgi:hypothetical protein
MNSCIPFYKKIKQKEKWNILKYRYTLIKNKKITNRKYLCSTIKYTNFKCNNEECFKLLNKILNIKEIKNNINVYLYNSIDKIKKEFNQDIQLYKTIFTYSFAKQIEIISLINHAPIFGIYYFDNNNRLNWFSHTGYIFNDLILKSKYTLSKKIMFATSYNYSSFCENNINKIRNKKNFFNNIFCIKQNHFYDIYHMNQNIFSCIIYSKNIDYIKYFFNKYYKYINCDIFCICLYKTIYRNNFEIFQYLMNNLILYINNDENDFNIYDFEKNITIILFSIINNPNVIYGFKQNNYKFVELYLENIKNLNLLDKISFYCEKLIINNKQYYTTIKGQNSKKTTILIESVHYNKDSHNILKILFKYFNITESLIKYNHIDLGNVFIISIEDYHIDSLKLLYNHCPDIINHKYHKLTPLHVISIYTNFNTKKQYKKMYEILNFLLKCNNLKRNIKDIHGRTPFMVCHPNFYNCFEITNNNIFDEIDNHGNNILMELFYDHNNINITYYKIENDEFYKFKKILPLTKNLFILNKEKKDLFQLILELDSTSYIKKKIFNEYYNELFKRKIM